MLATACFEGPIDEKGNRGPTGTDYFPSGQRYTGQYLLENQHGRGVCLHPSGYRYLGYMYAGDAEFCGRVVSPSGAEYQGMFSMGQPHGVGQMTYPTGARDAGLWSRGRLVRLLSPSPAAVRFDHLLTGHYIGWYDRRVLDVKEPESQLEAVLKSLECGRGAADCSRAQLDQMTNLKLRDRRTAGFPRHRYNCGARRVAPARLLAWNDTSAICDVQTYAYRTEQTGRVDAEVVSVSVEELLRPSRAAELPSGRLERASRLLLHASALDRADVARLLLRTVPLSADVMDAAGVTALICAAVRGHTATVNTLLDHGADVNHVTDEGVSALSVCLSLHHPDYGTRYHLDQLTIFTHLENNEKLAGVLEWHGGEAVAHERRPRPFPARPAPAARRQKTGRKPRGRRTAGAGSAEPPTDIRMALVPGPGAVMPQAAAAGPARARAGADGRRSVAPRPAPAPDRAQVTTRPRTPTAGTRAAARRSDGEASQGQGSDGESSQGQRSTAGSSQGQPSAADESQGQASEAGDSPGRNSETVTSQSQGGSVPGETPRQNASPECCPGQTTPPAWPTCWPEEPDELRRPTVTSLLTARTDDGTDGSWWERLPVGELRCCPSLERVLAAAVAAGVDDSNQETAVRLIEAFCSGPDGRWRDTEYSAPCPGSVNILPMIKLLLRRGASPEASKVPFPAVHHALLADDKPLLVALLAAGGDPNGRLSHQLGGLAPLHVSCALPGQGCLKLTGLLLSRAADPAVTSDPGEQLLDRDVLDRRQLGVPAVLGARTPLHVVCDRPSQTYDEKVVTRRLMDLLELAGADIEALCNGHSAMTLALRSGDMTLAVDLLTRGADTLRQLGPPHYDALGFAVSPRMEASFQPEERKQLIRTLLAYGSDLFHQYPLSEEDETGNILEFAIWINNTDDTLLTAPPHQLKGGQRGQKKQREAFLVFLTELLSDELQRHQQMAPLVNQGLFEEVELASAEPGGLFSTGSADRRRRRKKRKRVLLSAECFCPLCDRVLGKCFKGCPNYGHASPKLMSTELAALELDDNAYGDMFDSGSDEEEGGKGGGRRGRRRKRRAEASEDGTGTRVEVGGLIGPDGKPLKCAACRKVIKRRKVLCSACKHVMYCSKKCRASDWDKNHGYTCPARSQVSLARMQDSNTTSRGSSGTRASSGDSSPKKRLGSSRQGKSGRGDGSGADGRGRSLDGKGGKGRRRGPPRGARSLDARQPGQSGLTPIAGKVPPWLAAFMRQFQGLHVGECRHLVLGEWYEDDCKTKENYSFI